MNNEEIFQLVERLDGPALIAYVVDDQAPSTPLQIMETEWHSHARGQLFYLERGLISVRTEYGSMTLPPLRVGWMPPGEMHTVRIADATRGWGVHVAPSAAIGLPEKTCVLGVSELMRALVLRASTWTLQDSLSPEQERVLSVLMDEIRHAPVEPLHLNMPSDRRVLRIAHAVLDRPDDARSIDAWADWAGLSTRTVSRLFRNETGCSFAQWRQQARLARAMEWLAGGRTVSSVADALGYASISAFVAMFRRSFGESPGRYFAQRPV
jgi:AraC-like DNA-binding protein